MAIITLNPPFKTFRGRTSTEDGQVLYPFFFRDVSRTFANPRNDRTTYQTAIRNLFTLLTQLYSTVSDSQNEGWKTLAASLGYKDKDGNKVTVTPKAAFIQVNFWRVIAGQTTSLTAPVYASVPGLLGFSNLKRTAADNGWQFTYSWNGANATLAAKNTNVLPGLRRQPVPSSYRFSTTGPADSLFAITSAGGTITIPDADSRFPIHLLSRCDSPERGFNRDRDRVRARQRLRHGLCLPDASALSRRAQTLAQRLPHRFVWALRPDQSQQLSHFSLNPHRKPLAPRNPRYARWYSPESPHQ